MWRTDWTWAYWGLFGAGLAAGIALMAVVFWHLQQAYEVDALTRDVLVDALQLGLGALAMLLVSGWAFATRPTTRPPKASDSIWD